MPIPSTAEDSSTAVGVVLAACQRHSARVAIKDTRHDWTYRTARILRAHGRGDAVALLTETRALVFDAHRYTAEATELAEEFPGLITLSLPDLATLAGNESARAPASLSPRWPSCAARTVRRCTLEVTQITWLTTCARSCHIHPTAVPSCTPT